MRTELKWVHTGGVWELGTRGCHASIDQRRIIGGMPSWCFHVYVESHWVDSVSTFEQAKELAESYLPELLRLAILQELPDDT